MSVDFKTTLTDLERTGRLVRIAKTVSPRYELAALMIQLGDRPALFENVAGHDLPVATNVCASRDDLCRALGIPGAELTKRIARAIDAPEEPALVEARDYRRMEPDLGALPIPTYFREDGGPYITSGVVVAEDPEYGPNASFQRMMVIGPDRLAVRIVPRHLHAYLERGIRRFAICIGAPVQVLLAAAVSCEIDKSELAIANALSEAPLVEIEGFRVPQAEIVMLAEAQNERHAEGPFVDLTGTLDIVRQEPVIRIESMYVRKDPVFHAILPGGWEHKTLMGMPREPTIWREVNRVANCTGVLISPGGCSWLHAVVQIDKQGPGDGKRAIRAAFEGHRSLKHVTVVDKDVDIHDPGDVEWAVATRFQADRDLVVLDEQTGSSLDPSSDLDTRKTAKMGLDATIPWDRDREEFLRPEPPVELDLRDFADCEE